MVNLRFQGRKAERAKRDMAGATQAASSDRTPRGLTGHPIIPGPRPQNTEMGASKALLRPAMARETSGIVSPPHLTSTLDLVIALLTGIIVMGVSV